MPKDPDRSHLADAIHFMDLIDLADEELLSARATVERSKAAAAKFAASPCLGLHAASCAERLLRFAAKPVCLLAIAG